MTYEELIAKIAERPKMQDNEYYTLLLDHAEVIFLETSARKKAEIAKELGFSYSQVFSVAYKFILASALKARPVSGQA